MKIASIQSFATALAGVALMGHFQAKAAPDSEAIRPFHIHVPEAEIVELRRRIAATKWPERETVKDQSQGVQIATIQALAHYWGTEYDWRKIEARLNDLPNFITEIDGIDIQFIHVRSKHENALPIIVTHGWPGSIIEQMKLIGPLSDPTAYGGNAEDAFDIVIPSMPGYGFSGKPTMPGWGPVRIARAWDVLMKRLGYTKYVAQGGDWGAIVVDQMGLQAPKGLLAIHSNMPGIFPAEIDAAAFSGAPAPANLSTDEKLAYDRVQFVYQKGIAYGYQMGLRPQSLYGIADSPVGLAAYFLDHDARSYEMISRVFQGQTEGLTRDDVLDNITIAWLTNTGISGARLYWEYFGKGYFNAKGVNIPVAVSVFPDELYPAPRSWTEKAYPKLIHYNKLAKGGHFAAWEQPKLFSEELRTAFKTIRVAGAQPVEAKSFEAKIDRTPATPTAYEAEHAHIAAPTTQQPPAKIVVDAPLAEPLSRGVAFIEYRAENLRILPVFGPKALEVSPRVGHLHITVDDSPWHWADTSGNPIIVAPLPAGRHKVEFLLVDANHQPLDQRVVEFVIPERKAATKSAK